MPQLARCAAMREPMAPAPRTAALRISMGSAADADCEGCAAISAVADEVMRLQFPLAARLSEAEAERSRAYEEARCGVKAGRYGSGVDELMAR